MTKGVIMVLCGLGGILITLIIAIVLLLSWEKRKKDYEIINKKYGKKNDSNVNTSTSNNASIHDIHEKKDKLKSIEEDTVLLEQGSIDEDNTILLDDNSEETELLNEENISL